MAPRPRATSRLAVLLLLVAAVSLASVTSSSAAVPKFSFKIPARAEKILEKVKGFFDRNGDDLVDVIEKHLPPPPPPEVDLGRIYSRLRPPKGSAGAGAGLYTVDLAVGTPAQTVSGVMDISTPLVWIRCAPCKACPAPASSAFFKPGESGNYSVLRSSSSTCQDALGEPRCAGDRAPCEYVATYGDGATNTTGLLATDIFTFGGGGGGTAVPVKFGCSSTSAGDYAAAPGVIGFGRGPLSLVSQLGVSSFSYLLLAHKDPGGGDSEIQVGDVAVPPETSGRIVCSTPLLKSNKRSGLYYVSLTGIKVDGQELRDIKPGTFDLRGDGSGGAFLSTTVPVTYVVEHAYSAVRRAFVSRMKTLKPLDDPKLGRNDLCYAARSMPDVQDIPRLALVFDGADAVMDLAPANYIVEFNDGDTDVACLAVLPSRDASLLGSLLQMGTKMIYDLDGEQLTFVTESNPPPSSPATGRAVPAVSVAHDTIRVSRRIAVLLLISIWMLLF